MSPEKQTCPTCNQPWWGQHTRECPHNPAFGTGQVPEASAAKHVCEEDWYGKCYQCGRQMTTPDEQPKQEACPHCNGTGTCTSREEAHGCPDGSCQFCGGSGKVNVGQYGRLAPAKPIETDSVEAELKHLLALYEVFGYKQPKLLNDLKDLIAQREAAAEQRTIALLEKLNERYEADKHAIHCTCMNHAIWALKGEDEEAREYMADLKAPKGEKQ